MQSALRLRDSAAHLRPRARLGLLALLGAVAATGQAPLGLWWLSIPAFAACVAILSALPTWRAAAFAGWPHSAYPIAGKTGSAEAFGRLSTSWYASYGPTTDPEYVVVVIVEEGGLGSETAAPAARAIWEAIRVQG